METAHGRVPMPDPFTVLDEGQLLIMYGILERAAHRITEVAYLSNWDYRQWGHMEIELSDLAFSAYYRLSEKLGTTSDSDRYMYRVPGRGEWVNPVSRESR